MSQMGASFATGPLGADADDEVTAQGPVAIYSCSRIGRVANPPSFSFVDLFRPSRRR
jgi:hypothetical protein